ncbi:hypothetical protein FHS83_002562 [Rhizomicrobium palustre]|uniref:Uncharacterized protein n=1 Tax=Rhizomicrobium palustre TaxID=189966 RepID=A0A846MZZ3_9PROT|nr:hypothetical protein [Rhizomicrobium palustre]NIK89244.1 hypothetical protein [Rhizomicrobium palustre]
MSGCKIIRVKNILGELLSMPGGISREEAVHEAQALIEELREDCEKAVPVEITRLEDLVAVAGGSISALQLENLLDQVDPLLTLSGTFGSEVFDSVVKRFCDLAAGMRDKGITTTAPLKVHLSAMRLVYKNDVPEADCTAILAELSLIHKHYGIASHEGDPPGVLGGPLGAA